MARSTAKPIPFTVLYTLTHENLGSITVGIDGHHDRDDDDFSILDHELRFLIAQGDGVYIPVPEGEALVGIRETITLTCFIEDAEITSAEVPPQMVEINKALITLPDIGTVNAVSYGVVEVPEEGFDDTYELFAVEPNPGTRILVIFEIIGVNPVKYRGIDAENQELIDRIIEALLDDLGILEEGGDSDEDVLELDEDEFLN